MSSPKTILKTVPEYTLYAIYYTIYFHFLRPINSTVLPVQTTIFQKMRSCQIFARNLKTQDNKYKEKPPLISRNANSN